jgi:hypothetical protein
MSDGELEAIRRKYLPPDGVRILLLGESPPPGRGFFYTCDSSLYRFTWPVLVEGYGFPAEPSRFLESFAAAGFFLDDFSPIRGDKPARRSRDPDVQQAIERIAATISADAPVAVVGVLQALGELVSRTVAASTRPATRWECIQFPHPRNEAGQRRYQDGLRRIVSELRSDSGHDA